MGSLALSITGGSSPYTISVKKTGDNTERFQSFTSGIVSFVSTSGNNEYTITVNKSGCIQAVEVFMLNCVAPTPIPIPIPVNIPTPVETPTPTGIVVPECSVLINNNNIVYSYNPNTNTNTFLGSGFISSNDIAHTTTKLWMYSGTLINEYNITLNPWTVSLNRNITSPTSLGAGLFAINNSTLISSDSSGIISIDISNSTSVNTLLFALPSSRSVAGDILVTSNNKVLVTTTGGGNSYISQYDYITGNLDLEVNIGSTIPFPYGIFINDNQIYICNNNGLIYNINKNYPYDLTLFNNSNIINIDGASQPYSCGNTSFNLETPTPVLVAPTFTATVIQPDCSNNTTGKIVVTNITNGTVYRSCNDSTFTCSNDCVGLGVSISGNSFTYDSNYINGFGNQSFTIRVYNGSSCTVYTDYTATFTESICTPIPTPTSDIP